MKSLLKLALFALMLVLGSCNILGEEGDDPSQTAEFEVVEFLPAPGQFVNEDYTATTMTEACEYAQKSLEQRGLVSLGGFGGYIVVRFVEPIKNGGGYNFGIYGNSYATSSEPGIVWVAQDINGNGIADDEWFELYGSESDTALRGYSITYARTDDETKIAWRDSEGESGVIERNSAHKQNYFPAWVEEQEYTLTGTLLPDNAEWNEAKGEWDLLPLGWGYADNFSSIDCVERGLNLFRIANARTADGESVNLQYIDFVKVQSAVNAVHAPIGETSTEVSGFIRYM